jgi:hypothetical protein
MGNIPTNQGEFEAPEAKKPHKLSLETEVDGKHVSASLSCTRNGAILACDSELWFQTQGKLVALSSLCERSAGADEENDEGEGESWLQFELDCSHAFLQTMTTRADVGKHIAGVAKVTGTGGGKVRFDRETGLFHVLHAGWYEFRAEAWGDDLDFCVEDKDKKVLLRGGNPVWRLLHVDSETLLAVTVHVRSGDFLKTPGGVLVALRFHAAHLPHESFCIGADFAPREVSERSDSDTQSDLSID